MEVTPTECVDSTQIKPPQGSCENKVKQILLKINVF
jgi:hypothetical protein